MWCMCPLFRGWSWDLAVGPPQRGVLIREVSSLEKCILEKCPHLRRVSAVYHSAATQPEAGLHSQPLWQPGLWRGGQSTTHERGGTSLEDHRGSQQQPGSFGKVCKITVSIPIMENIMGYVHYISIRTYVWWRIVGKVALYMYIIIHTYLSCGYHHILYNMYSNAHIMCI